MSLSNNSLNSDKKPFSARLLMAAVGTVAAVGLGAVLFKGIWFYNESGYMTHVRTIFGDEKIR